MVPLFHSLANPWFCQMTAITTEKHRYEEDYVISLEAKDFWVLTVEADR